jgi:hypothetical protein
MTYALGRRLDAADMPAVRALVGRAEAEEYRFSAFVRGVVRTAAFQRKGADDATPTAAPAGRGR